MREAKPDEIKSILNWYRHYFDRLRPELQTDLLEEFLRSNVIDQKEGLQYLDRMQPEQLRQIGLFVGNNLDERYVQLFWSCWITFDKAMKDEFIKEFSTQRSNLIIMVAPFIDLIKKIEDTNQPLQDDANGWRLHYPYWQDRLRQQRQEAYEQAKNLIQIHFDNFSQAKLLVENLLGWLEKWDRLWLQTPEQKRQIAYTIRYLGSSYPILILPYVPRLVEAGIFDRADARSFYSSNNLFASPRKIDFFKTSKEAKAYKTYQQWRWRTAKVSRKRINQAHQAYVNVETRIARHVLSNFQDQAQYVGSKTDFLTKLIDISIPIFAVIEQFQPSFEEIKTILEGEGGDTAWMLDDLSDLIKLLEYAKQNGWQEKLENLLLNRLNVDLSSNGEHLTSAIRLVENIEKMESHLSEAGYKRLLKMINVHAPQLWFRQIDWAIKNQVTDLETLLYKDSEKWPWEMQNFYFPILRYLSSLSREEQEKVGGIGRFREVVRGYIREDLSIIFIKDWQHVLKEVFGPDEIDELINIAFTYPVDERILWNFLNVDNLAERDPQYLSRVQAILTKQPDLICQLMNSIQITRNILSIIPAGKIINLIISSDQTNLRHIVESEDFIR